VHIFIAYARNAYISATSQKSDVTLVFPDPDFLSHEGILAIQPKVRAKLHIFNCALGVTAIFLLPVKNPTSPSCCLILISTDGFMRIE